MSIFIIDQHPLMREALTNLLRRLKPDLNVVELDGFKAVSSAFELHGQPKWICTEIGLPDAKGVSMVRYLKSSYPDVPVIVFSGMPAKEMGPASMNMGATRYIEKSTNSAEIFSIFNRLLCGCHEMGAPSVYCPTRRQLEVLALIEQGFSNESIGHVLGISPYTVKAHLFRLYSQMDVKNRTQAVLYAKKHKFLPAS